MPINASLNFTRFTDPRVLWLSVDAVNAFFDGVTVSVNSENLPAATIGAIGGVKIASTGVYSAGVVTPAYVTINYGEGDVLLPSQAYMEQVNTRLENLSAAFNTMRAAMVAAGQLDIS